ncbi:MAG: glycoside hydrolase family 3 protein [Aphanocapsa lilacina HA4352-LM1]|jgi:beta-N-acetylhexosaminidase|nr:glycoside hydrolase family 3 protein [Aphanocapsa lilacina HA4352-LM1]
MISRRLFSLFALGGLWSLLQPAAVLAREHRHWVERTLAGLSLEAKIGQVMMPMLESPEEGRVLVERFGVGGLIIYRTGARALAEQLNALQAASTVPLLVSADFERGVGAYIDGATDLPIAMALGAAGDTDLARAAGEITAREARALGVHVVFAPVLDVNNNPRNPIINVRSFGQSPELVSRLAAAYIAGLESQGAMATAKHFPGHGNVSADTHRELAALPGSLAALEQVELKPFRSVLSGRAPHGVMAAHLWVQAIDSEPVPATCSPRVIEGFLRRQLGFGGLVYTDSLGMGAIIEYAKGDYARAQLLALEAGCDVLVIPTGLNAKGEHSPLVGVEIGTKAIKMALSAGRLSAERLDRSVRRILEAKAWAGLDRSSQVDLAGLAILGNPKHQQAAERIARRALTLVQDRASLLPLAPERRLGVVSLTNFEGAGAFGRDSDEFVPALRRLRSFEHLRLSLAPTPAELESARTLARGCDVLVVAAYLKVFVGDNSADLSGAHLKALEELRAINPRVVFISFGSPYALAAVRQLPTLICAYDDSKASQVTAAAALASGRPWSGRLPVSIER